MEREGPDIVCSMDETACKNLIQDSKELHSQLGGKKEAAKEEQVTMDFAFATVVTISPVKKGEKFTKDNIWVKRPGTGEILAEHYNNLLGQVANRDISNDEHLKKSDVNVS